MRGFDSHPRLQHFPHNSITCQQLLTFYDSCLLGLSRRKCDDLASEVDKEFASANLSRSQHAGTLTLNFVQKAKSRSSASMSVLPYPPGLAW